MQTVEFVFDFGSPNAYLCHRVIPAIESRTGARFEYVACLLGGIFKATGNQAPMLAFAGVRNKLEYERLEMHRFIERHGLSKFRMNPGFPVNTLRAMRGAVFAEIRGESEPYIEAMMCAMWEDGLPIADPKVFARVLEEVGLDSAAYDAGTNDPDVKSRLAASTERAVERGAFGSPTFFVGSEMWFGKERLVDVERFLGSTERGLGA